MPLHLEAPPILRALLVEVAGWRISRTASRALKVDATMQAPAFPKHRAIRSPTWLSLIRELSCCVCGKPGPSDAHHAPPKGRSGGGSDFETMPLCRACHGRVTVGKLRLSETTQVGYTMRNVLVRLREGTMPPAVLLACAAEAWIN